MNYTVLALLFLLAFTHTADISAQSLPDKRKILKPLRLANDYFMMKWPDPANSIFAIYGWKTWMWLMAVITGCMFYDPGS